MTSAAHVRSTTQRVAVPRPALRLKLKPMAPRTGQVDGAWWPRSPDLAAELPSLLAVLSVRLGAPGWVLYNLGAWSPAPRRIQVGGAAVRLAGYRSQDPRTIVVTAPGQDRVTLLVVPPGTAAATAHRSLMTASSRGNADSVEELLADAPVTGAVPAPASPAVPAPASPAVPAPRDSGDAAQRWEADGGRVQDWR
jgi:Family of unknown function (DUF5994)